MVPTALKAVQELEAAGISVELIDPRVLIPLDLDKIAASVRKTGRLLVVHEAPSRGGIGSEILSAVAQVALRDMKAARVLGAKNIPVGSGFAESLIIPQVEDVVRAAKEIVVQA